MVGHQFCAPYVVPLTVTKKALSLSDGDFAITDANGAVVLKVKGSIFSIRSCRTIHDGAGMPLLTMQEKVPSPLQLCSFVCLSISPGLALLKFPRSIDMSASSLRNRNIDP